MSAKTYLYAPTCERCGSPVPPPTILPPDPMSPWDGPRWSRKQSGLTLSQVCQKLERIGHADIRFRRPAWISSYMVGERDRLLLGSGEGAPSPYYPPICDITATDWEFWQLQKG